MRTKGVCVATLLGWGFFLTGGLIYGQVQSRASLRQLTRPAGYIFAGRVQAVRYVPPTARSQVATMQITFRIEQGLKGVRTGKTFTIREWVGAWNAGARYRVGERMALFLYPPSRLGLTSPVGGERGRFVLDRRGQVLLGMERAELFSEMSGRQHGARDRVRLREFVSGVRRAEEK
jgi:hypothetical protein